MSVQIGTTKGTGGDVLILEEAAYCDEGFFYETVAPILSVGTASLVAISTLTSEINFYTRLIKMRDPSTGRPLFTTRCIELVCEKCKEDGLLVLVQPDITAAHSTFIGMTSSYRQVQVACALLQR